MDYGGAVLQQRLRNTYKRTHTPPYFRYRNLTSPVASHGRGGIFVEIEDVWWRFVVAIVCGYLSIFGAH